MPDRGGERRRNHLILIVTPQPRVGGGRCSHGFESPQANRLGEAQRELISENSIVHLKINEIVQLSQPNPTLRKVNGSAQKDDDMKVFSKKDRNPNFWPSFEQINALRGFVFGAVEDNDFINTGEMFPDVSFGWLEKNVPGAQQILFDLLANGMVWYAQWEAWEGARGSWENFGLTEAGIDFLREYAGMPDNLHPRDQAGMRWYASKLAFNRLARPHSQPQPRQMKRRSPKPRSTTEWVQQISYSPSEALKAIGWAEMAARNGRLDPTSLPAIKAHITRRIARNA